VSRTPVNTRGNCAGRPAGNSAPRRALARASGRSRVMEGASVASLPAGIDVPRVNGDQATGSGIAIRKARGAAPSRPRRGVRGVDRQRSGEPKKRRCSLPRKAPRASVRQSIGPKPAARRQARRRWRPDDREVVRRRSPEGRWQHLSTPEDRSGSRALRGDPTRLAHSLQRWFRHRVLVT
jgi:hypothetical protein